MSSKHVFISYSTEDYQFVKYLMKDLKAAGLLTWMAIDNLRVGTPEWEKAIREAIREAYALILVASPSSGDSRYVRAEIDIAEMYKCPIYPLWANGDNWFESVPMALFGWQYADCRSQEKYHTELPNLIGILRQVEQDKDNSSSIFREENINLPEPRNPYKGLHSFTEEDTQDFFGREEFINTLITDISDRLEKNRFLAIVGPSGSGKSSVVMAGLLPKLQQEAISNSHNWIYLSPVVPGIDPIESLAVVIAEKLNIGIQTILSDFETPSARSLHLNIKRIAYRNKKVILFIDQFEEIFTQTINPELRNHFIDLLFTAATEPQGQTIIIITLRADFYDRLFNYLSLGQLLEKNHRMLLPMTINDLKHIIEKPAQLPDVKVELESQLVGDLLYEIYGQSGGLPLLEFTLDQLFRHRNGRILTLDVYRKIGGVKGALAKHAELTYEQLPSEVHQKAARILFMRLIEPGDTDQDITRRRAPQTELITTDLEMNYLLQEAMHHFVDARLLTTNRIKNIQMVEVSHEALIQEWERLSNWVQEARQDILIQQKISSDMREWQNRGRLQEDLYRGNRLNEAKIWAERNFPSQDEEEFIQLSSQVEDQINLMNKIAEQERVRVQTLYDIVTETSASLDANQVLPALSRGLERIAEAIGASSGVILGINDVSEEVYVLHSYGLVPTSQIAITKDKKPSRRKLQNDKGLAGWVLQNQQNVVIPDVQKDDRWFVQDERDQLQRSALAALLEAGEDSRGVIMFFSEQPNAFNTDHLKLVTEASSQLAKSMSNAELYSLIRDQAERLGGILREVQVESTKNTAILESVADGTMFANEKGAIMLFNSAAERILGLPASQVVGHSITEFTGLYGGNSNLWMESMERWRSADAPFSSEDFVEETLELEDGRLVNVRLSPVIMGKQFLGTVSVFQDITKLIELDHIKNEFVSTVSHELRTPTAVIKGYADLLLLGAAGDISETQQRFLEMIKQNADHVSILVNDLLEFSRIDQNLVPMDFTPVSVNDLLNIVAVHLQGRITQARPLTVSIKLGEDIPPIRADYDRIMQIMQNLADNAFNYTPKDGEITLGAEVNFAEQSVTLSVRDTGVGIPDQIKDRIFERFFRGDEFDDIVLDTPGTGLGLSIVQSLVQMHQGEIWFESERGKGTTFYVKIPIFVSSAFS